MARFPAPASVEDSDDTEVALFDAEHGPPGNIGVNTRGAMDQAGMRCHDVSKGKMVMGTQAIGVDAVRKADGGIATLGMSSGVDGNDERGSASEPRSHPSEL